MPVSVDTPQTIAARDRMLTAVRHSVAVPNLPYRQRLNRVLAVMRRIPRHLFVPENVRAEVYDAYPLPIGYDQTISNAYIVARMTTEMRLKQDDRVLEIGTGSGYQAAVLSGLVKEVYTIEIVPELAQRSGELLKQLGYANVSVRAGDGYLGWPEHGPFDAIIVTAAASEIPKPLLDQLKPGGRLIMPVGTVVWNEHLQLVTKARDGALSQTTLEWAPFVPLTGRGQTNFPR